MVGRTIKGRYEILERIGTGGMSLVYRGMDLRLNRQVAVKLLKHQWTEDEEVVRRFDQEARAAASLVDPHVVQVYDVGHEEPDVYFMVMELVEGETLRAKLDRDGKLGVEQALAIADQVAAGLEAAHRQRLVHRDIKPQNILLNGDAAVKVTDFGIAYAATSGTLVHTGSLLGTVQYLSPEQARGKMVSAQSDLYSLGVVLFEMLTGRLPFEGDSAIGVAIKHLQDEPPEVRNFRPDVSPAVNQIVRRAMSKDMAERFQTAQAFRQAIANAQNGDAGASPPPPPPGPNRRRRRRWGWVIALVAVLVLAGAGAYAFYRWFHVPTVAVPDVRGMSLHAAQTHLASDQLQGSVVGSTSSSTIPKGAVVTETPGPGSTIKAHQIVKLVLSSGQTTVMMPNLQGADVKTAQQTLKLLGLKASTRTVANSAPNGTVVGQKPAANHSVAVGTAVHLSVSNGALQPTTSMPSLVGMTVSEAASVLVGENLTVGTPIATYSTQTVNTIIDQRPAPYASFRGTPPVTVWVSDGPTPASNSLPQFSSVTSLKMPSGISPHSTLKVVVTDTAGNKEVYYQQVNPGRTVVVPITWYGASAQVMPYINGTAQPTQTVRPAQAATPSASAPASGGPGP